MTHSWSRGNILGCCEGLSGSAGTSVSHTSNAAFSTLPGLQQGWGVPVPALPAQLTPSSSALQTPFFCSFPQFGLLGWPLLSAGPGAASRAVRDWPGQACLARLVSTSGGSGPWPGCGGQCVQRVRDGVCAPGGSWGRRGRCRSAPLAGGADEEPVPAEATGHSGGRRPLWPDPRPAPVINIFVLFPARSRAAGSSMRALAAPVPQQPRGRWASVPSPLSSHRSEKRAGGSLLKEGALPSAPGCSQTCAGKCW